MATRAREPKPGELCVCGSPAVIVWIKALGEVPSCVHPLTVAEAAKLTDVDVIRRLAGGR